MNRPNNSTVSHGAWQPNNYNTQPTFAQTFWFRRSVLCHYQNWAKQVTASDIFARLSLRLKPKKTFWYIYYNLYVTRRNCFRDWENEVDNTSIHNSTSYRQYAQYYLFLSHFTTCRGSCPLHIVHLHQCICIGLNGIYPGSLFKIALTITVSKSND